MIVQCPACRELVNLVDFTAEGNVLCFTCPSCRKEHGIRPRETPATVQPAGETPPLVVATPAPEPAAPPPPPPVPEPVLPSGSTPEDNLWKAWEKVTSQWGNEKAHHAFIVTCQAADALPFAGHRYRERLLEDANDPVAKRGRDRVMVTAVALAQSQRESRPAPRVVVSSKTVQVVVLVLGLILSAFAVRHMVSNMAATQVDVE